MTKTDSGRFFEDFYPGLHLRHATPRTVTVGDQAMYLALTGSRFALNCSDEFARALGLPAAPLDDLLVFHLVFGKTVPDVSVNAVANLGYADCRFAAAVYPGDTLRAESRVLGVRETSSGTTGVVWIHTLGSNQRGDVVLEYKRWVLVEKRNPAAPAPKVEVPELASVVPASALVVPQGLRCDDYDRDLAGGPYLWEDFEVGERIDHRDGMTLEEAEHQMATRLYQNTARVHFDQLVADAGRFGRRIVYGGHVMSIARALSFNGLDHAWRIAAINGGRHVAPTFAGSTLFAWSQVLAKWELPGRHDLGALRLRTVATKDRPCGDYPVADNGGEAGASVVLDLDYSVLIPRGDLRSPA